MIKGASELYEIIVNNNSVIGKVNIYKNTWYNLKTMESKCLHILRRKTLIRINKFKNIVRI